MSSRRTIPLVVPPVGEDELAQIRAVFESGYLAQGPKVTEFERAVADHLGVRYAFAMSSATTALHLALVALGVGPGDEVLVPDFTFPATANVVVQQGARAILVDIDPATYTMDVRDLLRKIGPRSRAIMPVHTFGLSADMEPITRLAREHGLAVVEDAACAIGATYRGRPCGTLGSLACFSFHPRKLITTGEGGMIVTDEDDFAGSVRLLRSHGGVRDGGRFHFEAVGFNYRMSDVSAALGVAQIRKLDVLLERRRARAAALTARLSELGGAAPPVQPAWGGHSFQSYVVRLDEDVDRDTVIRRMSELGVETTIGTYALHAEPVFARLYGHRPGDLAASYAAYRSTLTLPMYGALEDADLDRIADALRASIGVARSSPIIPTR